MGSRVTVEYLGTSSVQTKAKVEEIKYSGTGSLGSRRIVDEFESHLSHKIKVAASLLRVGG